jgi:cell fate (sporulation/competence/biofilm development) regulator YlbF (YheA/YmcA/DUF963 family)
MPELPRYENMGVQYADLPRISTAPQQVRAQGLADIGAQIDRMTSFFQNQAAKDAEKAALKYAVEFPPTQEQLELAKQTGEMPKIEGAGRIFQETYNRASAHILGSELLTQFQNRQSDRLMRMERGEVIDPVQFQKDLRDDIDGTTAVLKSLDPETSIRFRAQMSTVGHAAYKQALVFDEKARQATYIADIEQSLQKIRAPIENVIKQYLQPGVDPDTGQMRPGMPIDKLEQVLQNMISPYTSATSIRMAGGNKYALEAYKIVENAKIGALVGQMTDRTFAPNAGVAAQKLLAGDAGNLTPLLGNLTQEAKDKLRETVIKSYSDMESLRKITEAETKATNKDKFKPFVLEMLNPNTTQKRKIEIAAMGIDLEQMTADQAIAFTKPPKPEANPVLFAQIYDGVVRGQYKNVGELTQFSRSLSEGEFHTLTRSLVDKGHQKAISDLTIEAGITSAFIDPGLEKLKKKQKLIDLFTEELGKKAPNDQGVLTYQTPQQATEKAIDRYKSDKLITDAQTARDGAMKAINSVFDKNPNLVKPNLPIEQWDFTKIKGIDSETARRLKQQQDIYNKNLR